MDKGMRKASEQEGEAKLDRAAGPRSAGAVRAGMTGDASLEQARQSGPGDGAANEAGDGTAAGASKSKPKPKSTPKKAKKRLHPALAGLLWTLRFLIVPVICIAALLAGLYLGYTKLGNGPAEDVWQLETWLHMIELIFSDS